MKNYYQKQYKGFRSTDKRENENHDFTKWCTIYCINYTNLKIKYKQNLNYVIGQKSENGVMSI